MKLAIAVPTYNESTNVKKLLPVLQKNLGNYPDLECTVFIVDDNSPDGTAEIALGLAKKLNRKGFDIQVIERKKKDGLGRAYVFAFHKILKMDYDHILQMDADLSHNPKYLPEFLDAAKTADLVVGSRYVKGGDTPDWQWHRKFLSRAGNLYTRLFLGSKITDYTGGFNLFSSDLLRKIDLDNLQAGGYGFLIELKYKALQHAREVKQIPIVFMDRTHGDSKLPRGIIFKNLLLVQHIRLHDENPATADPKPVSRWGRLKKAVTPEVLPILGITAGFFIELHHIVNTAWSNFFFANSDMVTLPLVGQSISLGEPFNWVFSSQIFLFPEAIIYAFSELLTPDFRAALILNAFINCLLLYALFRWVIRHFSSSSALNRLYSMGVVLFVLFMSFLEPRTGLNLASFYLVTTAYYGVVLVSLASVALSLKLLKGHLGTVGRRRILLILAVLSLLTTLSNPLYLFQFVAPLVVVCALAALINIMSLKNAWLIVLPQIIGGLVGMVMRKLFFEKFFSPAGDVGAYLHFEKAGEAMQFLGKTVKNALLGHWQDRVEMTILLLAMAFAGALFLAVIHFVTRKKLTPLQEKLFSLDSFFVTGLAALVPLSVIVGSIITGNPVTRYMVPLVIFPLLALIPLAKLLQNYELTAFRASLRPILVFTVCIVVLAGLFSRPVASLRQVGNFYTADEQCLDKSLAHTPYKAGVAQYWRSRGLQLNSRAGIKVMQVQGGLARFTWLYNESDYDIYRPSFVLVDKVPEPYPDIEVSLDYKISKESVKVLGTPAHIYHCTSFDIYTYQIGSKGQTTLDKRLHDRHIGMW